MRTASSRRPKAAHPRCSAMPRLSKKRFSQPNSQLGARLEHATYFRIQVRVGALPII